MVSFCLAFTILIGWAYDWREAATFSIALILACGVVCFAALAVARSFTDGHAPYDNEYSVACNGGINARQSLQKIRIRQYFHVD